MRVCKNLATYNFCQTNDDTVHDELAEANIPILRLPNAMDGEVKTRYIGLLSGFVFTRAWRYWCVDGMMPMDDAKGIFQEISSLGIRASGHAANPDPETVAYDPHYDARLRDETQQLFDAGLSGNEVFERLKHIQPMPNTPKYIRSYHIDTIEGLEAFAAYIRKHNIFAVPVTTQKDYAASVYPGNQKGEVN